MVWVWARGVAHMYKSWFDINDTWQSTLTNAQNQIRIAEYQTCGQRNTPDMLTIGQDMQSMGEVTTLLFSLPDFFLFYWCLR